MNRAQGEMHGGDRPGPASVWTEAASRTSLPVAPQLDPGSHHALPIHGIDGAPVILVVDHDVSMRATAAQRLGEGGYSVVTAGSGSEALDRARAALHDLVMLDLTTGEREAIELCRAMRSIPGGEVVPILAVTGDRDFESIGRAYEAGATDFIAKPLQWSTALHRIRFLIRSGQALAELQQAEARNRAMLEAVPDTLLSLSRTGTFKTFKPGAGALEDAGDGYLGRHLEEVLPLPLAAETEAAIRRVLEKGGVESIEATIPQGEQMRDIEARLAASGDQEVIALVRDVTGRKRHEEHIKRLAYFDPLTGLPNRVLLQDRLAGAVAQAERHGRRMALLFVDLDRFKAVNDSLGHKAGDLLLQQAGERLGECVRAADSVSRDAENPLVSRWAGDEFVVLLQELREPSDASRVAKRILERFSQPFDLDGREVFIGASIGIAVYPENGCDAATLVRNADSAMYGAKSEGRNGFRYYSESMSAAARERFELEADLRHAVELGQLVLHFQPKVELASGRVIGAEALLRWQHPLRGLVPPAVFVPIAEECGLIREIGRWVVDAACAASAQWVAAGFGNLTVAVNVSALQVRSGDFARQVEEALASRSLPATNLEIELTETVLFQDDEASVASLRALKALGVSIAIDDFGTGYSSLTYLQRFPLDTLKIDRAFVTKMTEDADSLAIVRTIIGMGHSLGLGVVAEGVETETDMHLLDTLGCHAAQGYGIAKPMPGDAMLAFLAERRGAVRASETATVG